MLRKFLLSVAVILLLCSGAFADIGQVERFSIGGLNRISRVGQVGSARAVNEAVIGHRQRTYDASIGSSARQKETARLMQRAYDVGTGGVTRIVQDASAKGLQHQIVRYDDTGRQAQGQRLTVGLQTIACEAGGVVGDPVGTQSFVGCQEQITTTPGGTSSESQFVRAEQYAAVDAGQSSSAQVKNVIDINMSQRQITTGPLAPPKPDPPYPDP